MQDDPLMMGTLLREPLSMRGERLFIEECDTVELARRFGTPLFVISERQLRNNLRTWQSTFQAHWAHGPVRILPSLKANPLVAVRKILTEEGAGCDIFGPGELECALRGGVTGDLLSVNGSIKSRPLIRRAIEAGARIVLDSPRELEICQQEAASLDLAARVLFRLKPYLADLDLESDFVPGMQIRDLTQLIKYGIPTRELLEMAPRALAFPNVDPIGVHVHMGRHSKRLIAWDAWIDACLALTREVSDLMSGWTPSFIDLGGGFPSPVDHDPDVAVVNYPTPPLKDFASAVGTACSRALRRYGFEADGITLEIEPGRGLHADTGIHLTTVQNVKADDVHVQQRWAELDTSEVFLGVHGLNLERPAFDYFIANRMGAEVSERYDLVGQTCNAEILMHEVPSPRLQRRDLLALLNTGAYAESCASNFNALPRPGTVLANGANADLIRRPETIEDVLARDLLPAHLAG